MLRVVLAVLLATALVGVSLPAVDDARLTGADAAGQRAADRLLGATATLHAGSDAGGRRPLTLSLPERSWTAAPIELRVEMGGVRWRVDGGRWSHRRSPVPLAVPDGPIVLDGGAAHLELSVTSHAGETVVVVRRGFT